jgi:hypothetical protein
MVSLSYLGQVDPPCALAVLECHKLVQFFLGADVLPQAYVTHQKRLNLDFIYWQHSWVMAFSQLRITVVPLAAQLVPWRSHIITVDWWDPAI